MVAVARYTASHGAAPNGLLVWETCASRSGVLRARVTTRGLRIKLSRLCAVTASKDGGGGLSWMRGASYGTIGWAERAAV